MSEMSDTFKLVNAMELAKTAQVGMELTYFDVIELLGELESLKDYIAELEAEKCVLVDQQREVKNILIDKNLHIDSLYEEGFKLQQRIAELEDQLEDWTNNGWAEDYKACIAELEATQRWIPVSERLPEAETRVLVFWGKVLDGLKVDWFGTAWRNDSDDGKWCTDPIVPTHWMPLPEPPKECD